MSFIIDFLLLAASGAACFYCWILNQRLKALTNTKTGLNTGIAALSQSTEDMQSAISESKKVAEENASQLASLLGESEKKIPELEALLNQLSVVGVQAVNDTETAIRKLVDTLSPHINDAKESAAMLLDSLDLEAVSESVDNEDETFETEQDFAPEEDSDDADEVVFVTVNEPAEFENDQNQLQGEVA